MVNTLERGGTERQFVTLAQGLIDGTFELHAGCLARRGEFVKSLPQVVEFPPGRSLFKLQSQMARITMARYLRRHKIVGAHAFDFYSNLMLIPAARLARRPAVL